MLDFHWFHPQSFYSVTFVSFVVYLLYRIDQTQHWLQITRVISSATMILILSVIELTSN